MSDGSNWKERAQPHPTPSSWTPTRLDLALAVLRNSPVEHHALTLALFKPNVAVDAMGNVLVVQPEDFTQITTLAKQTPDLPETGVFRNLWSIDQPTTSQPIDRLLVPVNDGEYKQISVQGYAAGKKDLKNPVGDVTQLPDVLYKVFELISHSRTGYERDRRDQNILSKVLDAIGED